MHCYAPKPWGPRPADRFVGQLMLRAVEQGKKPLALLPAWVNAVTQMDCWWVDWEEKEKEEASAEEEKERNEFEYSAAALFPQMLILEELDKAYPNAKFILNMRDARGWLRSVDAYGRLREILEKADLPGLSRGKGGKDEELLEWFEGHSARVRRHFKGREGSSLLAFSLEEGNAAIAERLEAFLGFPLEWGQHNATTWA